MLRSVTRAWPMTRITALLVVVSRGLEFRQLCVCALRRRRVGKEGACAAQPLQFTTDLSFPMPMMQREESSLTHIPSVSMDECKYSGSWAIDAAPQRAASRCPASPRLSLSVVANE